MRDDLESLTSEQIRAVYIVTNNQGPFADDLFYLVYALDGRVWRIPGPAFPSGWIFAFPRVDLEQIILAQTSTVNRLFLIWSQRPQPTLSELRARLITFLETHFVDTAPAVEPEGAGHTRLAKIANQLLDSYGDAGRMYHSVNHLGQCFSQLPPGASPEVELALWYHDVVYEPKSKRNEDESAERLKRELAPFNTQLDVDRVARMIRVTKHADATAEDSLTALLLDVDLSILGQDDWTYDRYCESVRAEYIDVWSPVFYYFRKKMLRRFLEKPIYQTVEFKEKFEQQARANLSRERASRKYRWIP